MFNLMRHWLEGQSNLWPFIQGRSFFTATYISKHLFLRKHWADWSKTAWPKVKRRNYFTNVMVTWPRWPPSPYKVKTLLKSSSLEPKGQWSWNLICRIVGDGPTKFTRTMILSWPWNILRQRQIWFLMHLSGEMFKMWNVDFSITAEVNVILNICPGHITITAASHILR